MRVHNIVGGQKNKGDVGVGARDGGVIDGGYIFMSKG